MRYKNNPFNIRYTRLNRWKGLIGDDNGFCQFSNLKFGIRAAAYILMVSYRKRGIVTYGKIISTWAPSFENPTHGYINFVCDKLHVFPFDELKTVGNYCGLLHYMWIFEQGNNSAWSSSWIKDVVNEFNLKLYGSK